MMALPAKTLAVRNLSRGEAVMFPFGGLNDTVRRVLSTCWYEVSEFVSTIWELPSSMFRRLSDGLIYLID
jgi:hypothetical protein